MKLAFASVLILNIWYFYRYYNIQEAQFRQAALDHVSLISYQTEDQVKYSLETPYHQMNNSQKISYLLHAVEANRDRFWLAHTGLTEPNLVLNPRQFLSPNDYPNGESLEKDNNLEQDRTPRDVPDQENQGDGNNDNKIMGSVYPNIDPHDPNINWATKPTLFYDPRLTLSVYIDEIKHQLLQHNPKNEKSKDHLISVPFDWSDWVDLTMLNSELTKPIQDRLDCSWLQSKVNKPTRHPEFCTNLMDLSEEELREIGLPSKEYLPGFVVRKSPMTKTPHEQAMFQGKAHLLAHQAPPYSIIFLTQNGTFEAQVSHKQRLVHSDLFKNYLDRKHYQYDSNSITLNPVEEFNSLTKEIRPRPLNVNDDIYKMNEITRQSEINASRELYLDPKSFHYQQQEVDKQIEEYDARLQTINDCVTNELHYNLDTLNANKLSRHELNHYNSLKYANSVLGKEEPTYYKLATLLKADGNKDTGWHYEWRFFNGGLRQLKEGWTVNQLEIREQIILDRLIRNWFRFAEEKGIISWIAHGPLLSWYWNGLMFPYDIDVDIQMPATELNRLSKHYNMSLIIEDINDGYGKYLIDCSTFLHHRNKPKRDNHIDARFIDIDTGTYIDITGLGKNDETPPPEYNGYIRSKHSKGELIELYMDRRKHWLNFEKISPIRYSLIGGVPVYVPNDIMSMLNHEYAKGTKSYHFSNYYYVPILRLWVKKDKLFPLLESKGVKTKKTRKGKVVEVLKKFTEEDKVTLLETNDDILMEYYLTHKYTHLHEIEKKFMLDHSLQYSITDLADNIKYHQLTSRFNMGKPLRKSLFDYEYIERFKHPEEPPEEEQQQEQPQNPA